MLTQYPPRHVIRGFAVAAALAAVMLTPAAAAMAMDAAATDVEIAPAAVEEQATVQEQATVDELRSLVDDLSVANDALVADNDELQQTIAALERERDQLRASLSRFDDLYDPLEADRQLLFELRKELPETRPEAEAQLARIRTLALASDPAGLGRVVDRLDDATPAFLDWRFGQWDSPQELSEAYVDSGANAFDSSMSDFRSEALRSVANRLDGLLTILDRIR
jgi:predicted RNase H-like nuclease (RuvC/YqgF family)